MTIWHENISAPRGYFLEGSEEGGPEPNELPDAWDRLSDEPNPVKETWIRQVSEFRRNNPELCNKLLAETAQKLSDITRRT